MDIYENNSRKFYANQIILTSIILSISVMGDSMLYGMLPSHLQEFGLSAGFGAGLILSVNRWIRLISNSLAAKIYNKFGLKIPLCFSLILAITSTASYGIFKSFWPLFIARIVWGLCFSIQIISLYMVVLREGEKHRARLMGIFNAIFRSGSLVAVFIGGILVDLIGIKTSFLIISSFTTICFIILPFISESKSYSDINGEQSKSDKMREGDRNFKYKIWQFLTGSQDLDRTVKLKLLAINFTRFTNTFAISGLVTATVGLLIRETIGNSFDIYGFVIGVATLSGIVLASSWASEVGLSIYFGSISDKFGRRLVLIISIPVIMVGTLLLVLQNVFLIIVVVPIIFAATTAAKITLDASAGDLSSYSDRAVVMSRYANWTDLGAASGPIAGYALLNLLNIEWTYLFSSILLGLGLLFYFWVHKSKNNFL